ncbi:MAG: hypothetical protein HQK60_20080 [Deltaproteobacteria bacterium]|nr:hypothetical protein [Deltaproteobacteria bacterium]
MSSIKKSKVLVIDACVAGAAGNSSSTDEKSRELREFLKSVLTICHKVIFTDDITKEWKSLNPWRV